MLPISMSRNNGECIRVIGPAVNITADTVDIQRVGYHFTRDAINRTNTEQMRSGISVR